MRFKLYTCLLFTSLISLNACQQQVPKQDDDTRINSAIDSSQTSSINLSLQAETLSPDGLTTSEQEMRNLDLLLRNDASSVNPHLDLNSLPKQVQLNMLLVCSDPTQPVVFMPITLQRDVRNLHNQAEDKTTPYFRTPINGLKLNLPGAPNFEVGQWRMALVYGGHVEGRKLVFDPNRLADVQQASLYDTDYGIEQVYGKKSNLRGLNTKPKDRQQMNIPFLSQWVTLIPGQDIIRKPSGGTNIHIQVSKRFRLRPQGTLLRIKLRNEGFAEDIKLVGMRLLTNSLAFRGYYDLSDANLNKGQANPRDLSLAWQAQSRDGKPYLVSDSITYRHPFPNFADFWLAGEETILRNHDADNYYVIWAMPIREKDKSRQGILHILLYDLNRRGDEYNRSHTPTRESLHVVIPKALIRKPAFTRSFGAGRFTLSDMNHNGTFVRLEGWQTPIYNALDFVEYDDAEHGKRFTSDFAGLHKPSGTHVPTRSDWSRIIPTKYPDNQIKHYKYYFYSIQSSSPDKIFNPAGSVSHGYNSNLYYTRYSTTPDVIGRGAKEYDLYLDEKDLPQGISFTPLNNDLDPQKVGKANNRVRLHLPTAMLVPIVKNGVRTGYYQEDADSHFSTYEYQRQLTCFTMVGWGLGQTYLSGYYYAGAVAGEDRGGTTRKNYMNVYGRYFGPAFHALYKKTSPPISGWMTKWPWDITFYGMGYQNSFDKGTSEAEDTKRTFYYEGYELKQADGSYKRIQGEADDSSTWMNAYWSTNNEWFFIYRGAIRDNEAPMGYDKAQNAVGRLFAPLEVKARVRLFRDSPLPRQH